MSGVPSVANHLRSLGQIQMATSVIVAGELRFMAQNSEQKAANFIKINAFLRRINLYGIDKETTEIYGDFKSEIIKQFGPKEKSKRKTTKLNTIGISENDLWIAVTALRHSLIVVSCDSDFERMQQVREFPLESWV